VAARQAAQLQMIILLARGFTTALADKSENNSLRELLKTAEVTQKRERVVITANVDRSLFSAASNGGAQPEGAGK
jgi:hypothetical protein